MAELTVEVPDDVGEIAKELGKSELCALVSDAVRTRSTTALLLQYADKLLKNSKITDELALKWGNELKERVARRHGL